MTDAVNYTPERLEEWEAVASAFEGRRIGPGWHRAPCPMCRDERGRDDAKSALGYNASTGGYNCFRCGVKGRLPQSYRDRIHDSDDPFAAPAVVSGVARREVEQATGYVPVFQEPGWSSADFEWARSYMIDSGPDPVTGVRRRGLSPGACYAAAVGAACWGKLTGRVIVPIPDYHDPLAPWRGWVSRDATGRSDRPYLYPKGMDRKGEYSGGRPLIYNEPALFERTESPVFVVEGVLDVLALWPDAVGLLGKELPEQVAVLATAARPVVVCLDGDAWMEGRALAWTLRHYGRRAGSVRLPPRTDPDEVERAWLDDQARLALG